MLNIGIVANQTGCIRKARSFYKFVFINSLSSIFQRHAFMSLFVPLKGYETCVFCGVSTSLHMNNGRDSHSKAKPLMCTFQV